MYACLRSIKLMKDLPSNGPNVSTTPIMAMGCQQCLTLSVVQLKGKHCRNPHCRNGVVDTFGHVLHLSTYFLGSQVTR